MKELSCLISLISWSLLCMAAAGQSGGTSGARTDSAWDSWRKGNVREAMARANAILDQDPGRSRARHLQILTSFVTGEYAAGLAHYELLSPEYEDYEELTPLVRDAYEHLDRLEEAAEYSRRMNQPEAISDWLDARSRRPMAANLDRTTIIPFAEDSFLGDLMPAVPIELNGQEFVGHLDTGGTYLAMSPKMTAALGIETTELGTGFANNSATTVSAGIAESLKVGDAKLDNVPVVSVFALTGPGIEDMIVIGTSILERFLVTWDNQDKRLILSPRGDLESRREHFGLVAPWAATMDFFVYYDHFLFAPGSVGEHEVVFFVDTGLVMVDSQGRQAAIGVTAEILSDWGFGIDLKVNQLADSSRPIRLGPLEQSGHAIAVLGADRDRVWQGMVVHALLAHGYTKRYIWTMDFENQKWYFSDVKKAEAIEHRAAVAPLELDAYVGQYEVTPGVLLEVTRIGSVLFLRAPGQQRVPLSHESDTTFAIRLAEATVEFVKDDSGAVTELILHQAGQETRARRID